MRDTMKRALQAKQAQRAKSAGKSVAEKLAVVERMRDRAASLKAHRAATPDKKGRLGSA